MKNQKYFFFVTFSIICLLVIIFLIFIFFLIFSGDFLHRNGNTDNRTSTQVNLEYQKDDYKALLNKLICPNCKNEQSFDEFFEKIRNCRRCDEKFIKSKVSCSNSFERKNKENEERRLAKLKAIENSVYGTLGMNFSYFSGVFFLSHF